MSGRLLTAKEVAERLAVTERYVWRLGREGELPRIELGRKCVRFDEADVDAFIERRKSGPRVSRAHLSPPRERPGRASRSTTPRRRF